jgi:hypothetical protein
MQNTIHLNDTFSTKYLETLLALKQIARTDLKELSYMIQIDSLENEHLQENYYLDIQHIDKEIQSINMKLIIMGMENIDIASAMILD